MATLESAEARFGKISDTTHLLKIPVLNDEGKRRLVEEADRGITPVSGLRRYVTFEDWQGSGGVFGKNNFWMHFKSNSFMLPFHEMSYMQRFVYLHPDFYDQLEKMTDEWSDGISQGIDLPSFTEEQERLYWDAYEKIANLVSADDAYVTNGMDLPQGEAYPALLFG